MTILAPVTNIQALTTVQRGRTLPAEGQVVVELGQRVKAGDVIAYSSLAKEHIMLDVGRVLGVPEKRIAGLIKRQVGEKVEKGAIIAGRRGIGSRILRSPADGHIAAISGSQILFQVSDDRAKFHARIPGEIIDLDPARGVVIECIGAWIQGAWGNGGFSDGFLQLIAEKASHTLTADEIDMSMRGSILVSGHCSQRQALELASQVPIRGLILGSLATRLLPIARSMEYPILLTEGFGEIAMNEIAFKLLVDNSNMEATINAQELDEFDNQRPEILIPIENAGKPPKPVSAQSFRVGHTVRMLTNPHIGQVGEITALLPSSTLFPSGLRAEGAEIAIKDGSAALLPLANLEVLG